MIYFRCDAGKKIGFGNLNRCLALAKILSRSTPISFLFPDSFAQAIEHVEKQNLNVITFENVNNYKDEIAHYPKDLKNIITDLGHSHNLYNADSLVGYFKALDRENINVVMLDGLADEAFRDKRVPRLLAYVQPYWGTENEIRPYSKKWFHGPKYALLSEEYKDAYVPKKTDSPENILVTFGGSDPQGITISVVGGVATNKDLNIRIIIGPYFEEYRANTIEKIAADQSNIEIIKSPENMIEHYQWADLCICGSGTSRYEAAACGTPVLFAAIDEKHIALSEIFAEYETSRYMGYYPDIEQTAWLNTIMGLQAEPQSYINMKTALEEAQKLGFGTENLAKSLLQILKA